MFIDKQFPRKHLYVVTYKIILKIEKSYITHLEENMTNENDADKFDSMPFIALIHNISKNRLRYSIKNPNQLDMIHEGRYLITINKRRRP